MDSPVPIISQKTVRKPFWKSVRHGSQRGSWGAL